MAPWCQLRRSTQNGGKITFSLTNLHKQICDDTRWNCAWWRCLVHGFPWTRLGRRSAERFALLVQQPQWLHAALYWLIERSHMTGLLAGTGSNCSLKSFITVVWDKQYCNPPPDMIRSLVNSLVWFTEWKMISRSVSHQSPSRYCIQWDREKEGETHAQYI